MRVSILIEKEGVRGGERRERICRSFPKKEGGGATE